MELARPKRVCWGATKHDILALHSRLGLSLSYLDLITNIGNKGPQELLCRIFECLADPRDLARAGQTCRRWYQVSKSTEFWKCLPLSLWERRIWSWSSVDLFEIRTLWK